MPPSQLTFGVDVARFGDDSSVIVGCRGFEAWIAKRLRGFDGNRVADAVVGAIRTERIARESVIVRVDEIGYGASVIDALNGKIERRELDEAICVVPINVARRADSPEDFHLLRDQLWFSMADWFKEGGAIAGDAALQAELASPGYGFDTQGRQKVDSKDEMKKRLGRSPDTADALALAVYRGGVVDMELVSSGKNHWY